MNDELLQWLQESKQASGSSKKPGKAAAKERQKPIGMCHICGQRQAKSLCIKCGKHVCTECYIHLVGLCKKCVSKDVAEKWKNIKPDWERSLGVEWID